MKVLKGSGMVFLDSAIKQHSHQVVPLLMKIRQNFKDDQKEKLGENKMKILSNKTYKELKRYKENYDKFVDQKNEEFVNHIHNFEVEQHRRLKFEYDRHQKEIYAMIDRDSKYTKKLENNIISLKNKINILVKKTK